MNDRIANLLSLDGKVAIVTGGATGIGEGIAHVLADAGAAIAIFDVDDASAVAGAIEEAGGRAQAFVVDAADLSAVTAAVDAAAAAFGRIDILVNNAGSYRGSGSIHDITEEMWRRLMAANIDTVFACSKAVGAKLVAQGEGGAIVNITSVDGVHPYLGVNYDAPKAAANFFTKTLALDLAPHGVRVNAVAPGVVPVETLARVGRGDLPPILVPPTLPTGLRGEMGQRRPANVPLGRPGTPEDVGHAVLFLCSDAASYVTGQVLAVEGGWLLV